MHKASVAAFAVLACLIAPPSRAQKLPQSVGEEVSLGQSVSGVPCQLRMTRNNAETGNQVFAVRCEGWNSAAASVFREPKRRWTAEAIVTESAWIKRLVEGEGPYECEAPKSGRVGGEINAMVRRCKLREGGWPTFALGAQFGDNIHGASGAPDVLPQIEAAMQLMAGRTVQVAAQNRQGLQEYNVRLLQETLGSDFKNVGLLDVVAFRNFQRLTGELDNMRDYVGGEASALRWLQAVEKAFGPETGASAFPLTWLGLETGRQARYEESEDYFRRADALARVSPDPNVVPYHLTFRAGIAQQRGDLATAKRLADESVAYRRTRLGQNKGAFLAHSLHRVGNIALQMGDLSTADTAERESLANYQARFGAVHYWPALKLKDLAMVQIAQNRLRDAEASARESVRIFEIVHGQRPTTVESLTVLGDILMRTNRMDEAFVNFRRAAQYAAANRDARPQQRVGTLARYYNALVPADGKLVTGALADELFSALQIPIDPVVGRSVTLMSARLASSDPSVRDLVREHQDASRRVTFLRSSLGRAESDESEEAQGRQQQLSSDIAAAEERLQRLEQQLQSANPRYARLTNPPPLSATELGQQLRPGEALLFVASGGMNTYVVLVRDGKSSARRIQMPIADLQKRIDALRAGVEWARRGESAFDLAAAHDLHKLIVGSLDAQLNGIRHLIVVASGPLANLPPALLVRTPPSGNDYGQAAWLVRDMSVSVMPSVPAIVELRSNAGASRATQPFLGFGNPRFTGGGDPAGALAQLGRACRPQDGKIDPALVRGLAPLPDTQDELKAIGAALKAAPNSIVTGAGATLAELRKRDLSKVRILAFATHGLLPGELPCQTEPALVLTPGAGTDDGLLNASDIARLRLDAEWVVLSACNTAGADGSARGGQALSGLVRAFLYAGSRAVLATHWDIASEPTVQLTTTTFRNYTANPSGGRAEALRKAQLAMIGDPRTAHPVFWAPFVVVGEGGL